MRTSRDVVDHDVVDVHVTGDLIRDGENDVAPVAHVVAGVDVEILPRVVGCGRELADGGEGVEILGVGHHAHLDLVAGRSLVGVETDLDVVHLHVVGNARRGQVGVVGAGAVEIDGIGAGMVLGRGGVGVGGGAVVGIAGPAGDHVAGAAGRGRFKVLHVRQVDGGAGGAACHRRPSAVLTAAADGTDTEMVFRVGGEVQDGVGRCHGTLGSPRSLAVSLVLEFPGGLRVAGRPGHGHAVVRHIIDIHVGGNTCDRVVAGDEELHIAAVGGGVAARPGGCGVRGIRIVGVVVEMQRPVGAGVVCAECVGIAVVRTGVIIYHKHQVVRAVVLERGGEHERVPSLAAIQRSGIDLLQSSGGYVVRGTGERGLGGVA